MKKIKASSVVSVKSEPMDMEKIPLDDKKCFKKLNDLDVFGIFQFETKVAIGVINEIGIDSFDDMYAATTLGRPDPLSGNLHVKYGQRKRNQEYWESIPVVSDVLDESYNLPIYQESSMILARRLAGFSGSEANALRKGLAKGKDNVDAMKKLQSLLADFKNRAQDSVAKKLITQEQLDRFVETLEKFGGYGFNKCLSPDTIVQTENGYKTISELKIGEKIVAPNDNFSDDELVEVIDIIDSGLKNVFEIELESGHKIKTTKEHKFLCEDNQIRCLSKIITNNHKIMTQCSITQFLKPKSIMNICNIGKISTMDITVKNNHHLFYANNGVVTSNSHAVSYALVAYWSLYLKTYFPVQFMVALLNFTDLSKKDEKGGVVLKKYIQYAKRLGVQVAPPDINTSEISFSLDGNIIRWGLGMVKGLGPSAADEVLSKRPYDSFDDVLDKVEKRKLNKSKVLALIKCGAFDKFGEREYLINYYLGNVRKEKGYEFVPFKDEEKQKAETELLGMSISFSIMPKDLDYDKLSEYGVMKTGDLENTIEGVVLGKIGKVKKTQSRKSGRDMLIVEIADDFHDITFFVWDKDIEFCEKNLITGHIMTVPLRKFDMDSDGCFYCGPQKDLIDLS